MINSWIENGCLKFGKYRGEPLEKVDKSYLQWLYETLEEDCRTLYADMEKIERYLE